MTTLAISFDHRLVDGAQGSTFLADVAAILADPSLALLLTGPDLFTKPVTDDKVFERKRVVCDRFPLGGRVSRAGLS